MASEYLCPHCGTMVDTDPDIGGGDDQDYIEDCPICCRPIRLRATLLDDSDSYAIEASAET